MRKSILIPLFLLSILPTSQVWADSVPHFDKVSIDIRFRYSNPQHPNFTTAYLLIPADSTGLTWKKLPYGDFPLQDGHFDEMQLSRGYMKFFAFGKNDRDSSQLWIWGRYGELSKFKLLLIFPDREVETPILQPVHRSVDFELLVTPTGIIDETPYFQMPWREYFRYFFATLLVELFVGSLYFWRYRIPLSKLHAVATANIISHPVLWIICTSFIGFGWGKFLGEIAVVFFEAWWIMLFTREYLYYGSAIRFSLLLNVSSLIFGIFLIELLSHVF